MLNYSGTTATPQKRARTATTRTPQKPQPSPIISATFGRVGSPISDTDSSDSGSPISTPPKITRLTSHNIAGPSGGAAISRPTQNSGSTGFLESTGKYQLSNTICAVCSFLLGNNLPNLFSFCYFRFSEERLAFTGSN